MPAHIPYPAVIPRGDAINK